MAPTCARISMGEQDSKKWLPPACQSLRRGLATSCLFSRCYKISKQVSFIYCLWAFRSDIFALVSKVSESVPKPIMSSLPFPQFCSFPECIPCCFSKPDIWGAHLTLGFLMWSSNLLLLRESLSPLPSVECCSWVYFFPLETMSLPSTHLSATPYCVGSLSGSYILFRGNYSI